MSSDNQANIKSIPNSLIKKQIVKHGGQAHLIAEGKLQRTEDHEVFFSFEIAPFGKELRNSKVFWTGPVAHMKVSESDILKGGSDSLMFTWDVDPLKVNFPANSFVSAWGDGLVSLQKNFIKAEPEIHDPAYFADKAKSWCYRFVLAADSYEGFRVILETVPTSLEVLAKCTWAESLVTGGVELDVWNLFTSQALPKEFGSGILPILHDTRLPNYEKESLLPVSQTIRTKVWETLSSMGSSQPLEDAERLDYDPAKKQKPPVFPSIDLIKEVKSAVKRKSEDAVDVSSAGPGKFIGLGAQWS